MTARSTEWLLPAHLQFKAGNKLNLSRLDQLEKSLEMRLVRDFVFMDDNEDDNEEDDDFS